MVEVQATILEGAGLPQCPHWVRSGYLQCNQTCPLYPRKQTCAAQLGMSALGQKWTHAVQQKSILTRSTSPRATRWIVELTN